MKYTLPRNPQVPDPSLADIIASGALVKDRAGLPEGQRIFVYRGNDPRLPKSDFIPAGLLFPYDFGLIYLPDAAPKLSEFVAEVEKSALTLALGVLPAAVLGALAPPPSANKTVGNSMAELEKRGALSLPGVEIVEIEHQVVPGKFLSKKNQRLVLTYQRLDGQLTTYTFVSYSANAQLLMDTLTSLVLKSRWKGEFDYLVTTIKSELVDATPIWDSFIATYQSRHGKEWVKHINELSADVKRVADAELEQKGFPPQRVMGMILERIAPLVPSYQQVPELKDWVRALKEAAAGAPLSDVR